LRGTQEKVNIIELKACKNSDPNYGSLCPEFSLTIDEISAKSSENLGILKGIAGEVNSAYLVFGIRMVEGAKINLEKLKLIRVVAFASSGIIKDFEKKTDSPITSVHKKIASAKISAVEELNYLVKISRNIVTHQSDDFFL
jgi:hypothetical protein